MEKEMSKSNQSETTQRPNFLCVTEVSKYKVGIYVTEDNVIIQDFEHKDKGLLIPFTEFKARNNGTAGASETITE